MTKANLDEVRRAGPRRTSEMSPMSMLHPEPRAAVAYASVVPCDPSWRSVASGCQTRSRLRNTLAHVAVDVLGATTLQANPYA